MGGEEWSFTPHSQPSQVKYLYCGGKVNKLRRFLAFIDSVNERIGSVAWFLIPILMLVVVYEVVARYAFKSPTIWAFEVDGFLLITIAALGGGWTLLHRGHVNVDIVYGRFSTRGKAIIDIVTFSIVFSVMFILIREFTVMALKSLANREVSQSIWAPPLYPIKFLAVVGIFFMFLQCFAKFARDLVTAVTGIPEKRRYVGMFEKAEQ